MLAILSETCGSSFSVGERCGVSPPVFDLESSRHFPSAEAFENTRIGGRHTECACYFVVNTIAIGRQPTGTMQFITFMYQ